MSLASTPLVNHKRVRVQDTWRIENVTDSPVVLLAVAVAGAHTYDTITGQIRSVPVLPNDNGSESGVTLSFDNQKHQTKLGHRKTWSGVHVPPGATLQATVLNNRELRLTYSTGDGPPTQKTIVVRGEV